MEMKKTVITFIIILICITLVSGVSTAYFDKVYNFVKDDKKVRLQLFENKENITFIPRENISVNKISRKGVLTLEKNHKYFIKVQKNFNTFWRIQVLATHNSKKITEIKKQLINMGYKNIIVNNKKDWYRIQLGNYYSRKKVEQIKTDLKEAGWPTWIKSYKIAGENESMLICSSEGKKLVQGRYLFFDGSLVIEGRSYPGSFEVLFDQNNITVFNTISFKTSLQGVLTDKLSNKQVSNKKEYFSLLKAQAVACRSYLLSQILKNQKGYLDLDYYQGLSNSNNLVRIAVIATRGEILQHKNNILDSLDLPVTGANTEKTYQDILVSFYPNTVLEDLSGVLKQKLNVNAVVKSGLRYQEINQLTWSGPRLITLLDLNLNKTGFQVVPFLSQNKVTGFEYLSKKVQKTSALAGINGGFFSSRGQPLGLLMINRQIVTAPIYNRTVVGITSDNEVMIDRVNWQGLINDEIKVDGINQSAVKDGIILYNKYYGKTTPELKANQLVIIVKKEEIISIKQKKVNNSGGIIIPEHGFVIMAAGKSRQELSHFHQSSKISFENKFSPDWNSKDIVSVLGAGPKLITDGKIDITAREEQFQIDITEGRAPRSALGLTDNNHLLMVTVDGRQPELSIGMSLEELAEFMKDYSVVEAMNLDGGNSAQMVIRSFTVNNPSQTRLVANGLLIKNAGN